MSIRVLIVDDHSVVRPPGLRMFLGLDAELEVVGEAIHAGFFPMETLVLAARIELDAVPGQSDKEDYP
jgi:DNA-binding NarL/FixJ family response regulator